MRYRVETSEARAIGEYCAFTPDFLGNFPRDPSAEERRKKCRPPLAAQVVERVWARLAHEVRSERRAKNLPRGVSGLVIHVGPVSAALAATEI